MSNHDLVRRLRGQVGGTDFPCLGCTLTREAADRIEDLEWQNQELLKYVELVGDSLKDVEAIALSLNQSLEEMKEK